MSTEELLKTIRAEIERLKYPTSIKEAAAIQDVLNDLLAFIDSLPEEQPEDFNDTFDKYMKEEWSHGTQLNDIARHFYELGQQGKEQVDYAEELKKCKENPLYFWDKYVKVKHKPEEQPCKDLEEAAEKYRRESYKKAVLPNIDGPMTEYGGNIKDAFKAGAEWMAKLMPMPEDTVIFQKGVAEGKRLMMENAIDAPLYRDGDFLAIDLDMGKLGYEDNDKVKLIILKEEEL